MKIGCVLVLYKPNENLLAKVVKTIENQVNNVFVVDNSPQPCFDVNKYSEKIIYYPLEDNLGIAFAQNLGVRYFMELHFDFIFYLDQDSIVPEGIVTSLIAKYKKLTSLGIKIGALGPRPVNRQSNKKYIGSVKKGTPLMDGITEVTELISSASLIPLSVFAEVGLMEESLFIDGVDHEWCWRAHKLGRYRFFIIETVLLSHQLGEGDRFFIFRKVAIPTPFRVFYQYRNYFILLRRRYVPFYWKASNGFKYFVKMFYYPLFITPRMKYLSNIFRGVFCGVFRKN